MTPPSLGYIAGFVDGEGSIGIVDTSFKRPNGNVRRCLIPFFIVSNNNRGILEGLKGVIGGAVYRNNKDPSKGSMSFCLHVSRAQISRALSPLVPHLVVKRRQAELVLKFISARQRSGTSVYTTEDEEVVAQVRHLNRRGPR